MIIEKSEKTNVFMVFEKKSFYMYLDIISSFMYTWELSEKKNGNSNYIYYAGNIVNIKQLVERFKIEVLNNIINEKNYLNRNNSCFVLYSIHKTYNIELLFNLFNYLVMYRNLFNNNVIEIESVKQFYDNYNYAYQYIDKMLDNVGCISFYKQNIYKPDKKWEHFNLKGYEILSRIKIQDNNILPPAEFFEIIEKTPKLFEKFELHVFDNFLRLLKIYNEDKVLHINFSPDFIINFFRLFLDISKDNINKFIIEINEKSTSAITSIKHDLFQSIQELHKRGFQFVFDDFGEGINNIEILMSIYKHLKGIKIGIKIFDSIFYEQQEDIKYKVTEEVNQSIFLIKFFESFQYLSNLAIYYEGIDSQHKLKTLSEINVFDKCYLQGFYFHKPEKLYLSVLNHRNN